MWKIKVLWIERKGGLYERKKKLHHSFNIHINGDLDLDLLTADLKV